MYQGAGANLYRTDHQGTVTVTVKANGSYTITTERGAAVQGVPQVPTPGGLIKTPQPALSPPVQDVYYANCSAVRTAGKSPLLRGQPGYRPGLDRDGDGRACE
ncbi:hypothetical protein Dxin01_03626 [Deinococcus xinjiangensis]|uniref:Excalibur calcium-binding domain-containing protein n=1 Tax=Deinococcus xinjiangensis TaxID=457454 RepID=A0ABP9VF55_9DEIO